MFNCIKNLITFQTDAEKIADAKFDKQKYQAVKLENGQYSFNWKYTNYFTKKDEWVASKDIYKSLDALLEYLEWSTQDDLEKKAIEEAKREVIS